MYKLFFFAAFLFLSLAAHALDSLKISALYPSNVTVYDTENGLINSCVEDVFIDAKGRLWLNACRHDGYDQELSFFQFDGDESYGFNITDSTQEAQLSNWFVFGMTADGILFGEDRERDRFFLFDPSSKRKKVYSFDQGTQLLNPIPGENGEIYLVEISQRNYLIYSLSFHEKKLLSKIPSSGPSDQKVTHFKHGLRMGSILWFFDHTNGFIQYNLNDSTFRKYEWSDFLRNYELGTDRMSLVATPQGNLLFFLDEAKGFYLFNIQLESLSPVQALTDYLGRLPIYKFHAVEFYEDNQKNILINIDYQSAQYVTGKVVTSSILLDADGQLFDYDPIISTAAEQSRYGASVQHLRGIASTDFKREAYIAISAGLMIAEVQPRNLIKNYLDEWPSRGMVEIGKNRVIVLSDDGRVSLVDLEEESVIVSPKLSLCGQIFPEHAMAQLTYPSEKQLWFPIDDGQLLQYDQSTEECTLHQVGQSFFKFTFIGPQELAFINPDQELWIYHLGQKSLRPVLLNGKPFNKAGFPNQLHLSRDSTLWLATQNGLWQMDLESQQISKVGKEEGLTEDGIMCIHETRDGELWLGSFSGGIYILDPQKHTLRIIDQDDGLSNNTVVGMLEDHEGDIWVATYNGITVVSATGEVLFELQEKDGLSHREFNRYSYLKTRSGQLIFGGIDGISILQPEVIKPIFSKKRRLQLYLTGIRFFDKKRNEETQLNSFSNNLTRINLPATHRYIKLDFGLSDYRNPAELSFDYRLAEVDEREAKDVSWTHLGANSDLTLNDMPVGIYNIVIRATNQERQRVEAPLIIPVRVNEFFYKTWWFYLLCSLPFLAGTFFWYRHLLTEKKRLEIEVEKRTHQIRIDKQLIEKQALELKELDEMKSRFFTNISHEFRTPLTIITGMANQLKKNPDQWLYKGVELIQRNSQQLLSLINQILDLRKLESGALQLHPIQANVVPYLKYITDSFTSLASSSGIKIHFLSNLKQLEMDYDPDKLLHILSNLLSNAIKYTPDGGDIYVQIDQKETADLESLLIQVKDTGQGIAPEALPYVFDRFYQVQDLANQKPHGTGIGLALTQELVRLLGGTIEVESTVKVGSCFTIRFPITRKANRQELDLMAPSTNTQLRVASLVNTARGANHDTPQVITPIGEAVSPVTPSTDLPSLLVVEDNEDVQYFLRGSLQDHYQVVVAGNGQEGIDRAVQQVPDLIISDIMMPVKNGYELCDTLKNDVRTSHIPIVLLTAKADFESKMKGLQQEADAYLTKPFQEEELKVILKNLLEVRRKLQLKYAGDEFIGEDSLELEPKAYSHIERAFLEKLEGIIVDHIEDTDLNTDFICRKIGMSSTNIYRKLKALTNLSLSHYIRHIRLERAKELLADPSLNITQVAYAVGFSDPSYFSRIFAETYQQSPTQYRNH